MSSVSHTMPARRGSGSFSLRVADGKLSVSSSTSDCEKPPSAQPVPFVQEDGFTDLVLIVEGKRLYTSKSLLSMSSPVFARMLSSAELKDKKEVPLQGKSYDTIHEMLYILHPAYQRKITDQTAFAILPLAEEYQIWNIKQRCEETLLQSINTEKSLKDEQLIRCLQLSDTYKLFALWAKCLQLFSKPSLNLSVIQRNPEYENLSRFLKSMLEAFKSNGNDSTRSLTDSGHVSGHVMTQRRGSSKTLIDETHVRKSFSNSHTQTKF